MANIRIGLSGYAYPEWQGEGLFYPPKLAKSKFLGYYATRYATVEGVGMFTRMPSESTAERMIKECPGHFHLSPKMHQSVTHFKRLKPESIEIVESFLQALTKLETAGMMGPVLVQLPPNFKRDLDRLKDFLVAIPHRSSVKWAFEFRHPSWQDTDTEELLREFGAARVADDTDEADAVVRDTADNVYVRLRKTDYDDVQLRDWAGILRTLNKDCHVYVRHTDVEAPWRWADRLLELTA
ncbi:MAG: DUF72 domain-containing protein [Armatimonadetes bacterium]|nr:DUF72 domain-containing protein [Armatimonadota bacterium]